MSSTVGHVTLQEKKKKQWEEEQEEERRKKKEERIERTWKRNLQPSVLELLDESDSTSASTNPSQKKAHKFIAFGVCAADSAPLRSFRTLLRVALH